MADLSQLTNAQLLALSGSPTGPAPSSLISAPPAANDPFSPSFDLTKATNAQLQAYAASTNPNMSTGEDIARSGAGGLQRGVTGLGTAARGISGSAHSAAQAGVDFLARHGIGDGSVQLPDVSSLIGPHVAGKNVGDIAQLLVKKGVQTADQHLPSWLQLDPTLAQAALSTASPTAGVSTAAPTPEQAAVAANGGVPIHVPQTTAGRYAQRIAEFAPMATTGGGPIQALANVVVPAVASQGAQDIAPQNLKGLAALGGALLGGGFVAAGSNLARAPEASFGSALGDVTDAQMQGAQQLRQDAAARGLNLTVPEAVQQVTNNGTGLGRLQRVIEGTKQGQALTAPYFAERPDQVAQAVRGYADTIAPPSTQPSMIGVNAQEAATGALDQARRVVNNVAGPDYAALPNQTMDPQAYAVVSSDPSYRIALEQLRAHPELGQTVAGLPDNSLAVVNAVKQRLGTLGEQAQGTPLAPGDNQLAALRFGARASADQAARAASPNYAAANDTVRELSGQFVDPLKAGPLGTMSATSDVPSQTGALYPRNPLEGAPNETAQAIRVLGATSPGTADALTRQHLVNALDTSLRDLQTGQNQYAGAKFAVRVAGSPEQAATLGAGVGALPDGAAKASDLDNLLEALRATGKRQPPGSMTAFNENDLKDLHITPFANAVGRIADPLEWGKGIGDVLNRANYRRNVDRLSQIIMANPDQTAATLQAAQEAAANRAGSSYLPTAIMAPRNARH